MAKKQYENILNEKDSLTDILTGEKELVKLYGAALTETSGKELRRALREHLQETAEDQFALFKVMQKNGYYEPKPADKSVIDEKAQMFSKSLKQIGGED
ncbi:MAG: spore coat protein [Candidatus Borkfalkiaceae bacterium]|nr:spore coat protein [Christensenellaceae bacterium]